MHQDNGRARGDRGSGEAESRSRFLVLGICAMDVKARSKSMLELIRGLIAYGQIEIVIFSEDTILHEPIESWTPCNMLIAFYSHGFPLEKAIQYCKLHRPFLINDLHQQKTLMDRRKVYEMLSKLAIPTPPHVVLNRDDDSVSHATWRQVLLRLF